MENLLIALVFFLSTTLLASQIMNGNYIDMNFIEKIINNLENENRTLNEQMKTLNIDFQMKFIHKYNFH